MPPSSSSAAWTSSRTRSCERCFSLVCAIATFARRCLFIVSSAESDQRQSRFWINPPMQMFWGLGQNDFQGWPHVRLQQMAAMCAAIRFADHDMGVDLRLGSFEGYIADQRKH